jgi:hypothetical protein
MAGHWDDALDDQTASPRKTSAATLRSRLGGETLIIKRSIAAKGTYSTKKLKIGSWTRQVLREHHLPAFSNIYPNRESIEARIAELRHYAAEEHEPFSETSANSALSFCCELAADYEPALFLMANGNLRAIWQNAIKDQIGIQFMANAVFQYVILRDRGTMTLKALGEDTNSQNIRAIVELQGLTGLWFSGQR